MKKQILRILMIILIFVMAITGLSFAAYAEFLPDNFNIQTTAAPIVVNWSELSGTPTLAGLLYEVRLSGNNAGGALWIPPGATVYITGSTFNPRQIVLNIWDETSTVIWRTNHTGRQGNTSNTDIVSISGNGNFIIDGGSLQRAFTNQHPTLDANHFNGNIILRSGTISGTPLAINGGRVIVDGSVNVFGTINSDITVLDSGRLIVPSGETLNNAETITNGGTIEILGTLDNNGIITNIEDGKIMGLLETPIIQNIVVMDDMIRVDFDSCVNLNVKLVVAILDEQNRMIGARIVPVLRHTLNNRLNISNVDTTAATEIRVMIWERGTLRPLLDLPEMRVRVDNAWIRP
ncbi:MAG: hypothetical protein FWE04_00875 [Oscillospiraceae bacterium]|nr:hypothetical protein [Oscillospiraceae bacterium]